MQAARASAAMSLTQCYQNILFSARKWSSKILCSKLNILGGLVTGIADDALSIHTTPQLPGAQPS